MTECILYVGRQNENGIAWNEIGRAPNEQEAEARCTAKVAAYLDGHRSCVVYPLGPRGTRKWGQPVMPFPRGNTYLVAESHQENGTSILFSWKLVK